MKTRFVIKWLGGTVVALAAIVLAGVMNTPSRVQAQDDENSDVDQLVHIGYTIAPVPLNLEGKDSAQRRLVGLGSFIVNAQADCNGCHTAGGAPNFNYANNGNPYFLNQPLGTKTDPTTYLAGGTPFGQAVPSSASVGFPSGSMPSSYPPNGYPIDPATGFPYAGPVIISRNLTPDKNGRPEGGRTLEEFKEILRTGKDFDNIHPTCQSDTDPNIALAICVPPPVDGSKLQVMPWPLFHNMTDHQIEAIYEYLSVIPCIDNNFSFSTPPAGAPNELRNDCGRDSSLIRHDAALFHGNARANTRR
jgi:hypothetical protein